MVRDYLPRFDSGTASASAGALLSKHKKQSKRKKNQTKCSVGVWQKKFFLLTDFMCVCECLRKYIGGVWGVFGCIYWLQYADDRNKENFPKHICLSIKSNLVIRFRRVILMISTRLRPQLGRPIRKSFVEQITM